MTKNVQTWIAVALEPLDQPLQDGLVLFAVQEGVAKENPGKEIVASAPWNAKRSQHWTEQFAVHFPDEKIILAQACEGFNSL